MDFETLAAGLNCTPPAIDDFPRDFFTKKQRSDGGVVVHVLLSLYLFVALAVVCDKYFVPAVEKICHALNMSADVAGATFMAAATSAPELFVNVIGTFITEGDIGVGTIVGSAVFNILAVAACCGIGAGMCGVKVVPLDWWPLTRDCLAYGITVSLLICIIHDERVEWYEALTLVLLYIVYILIMYFDKSIQRFARGSFEKSRKHSKRSYDLKSDGVAESHLPLKLNKEGLPSSHDDQNPDIHVVRTKSNKVTSEDDSIPHHQNGSIKVGMNDQVEVDNDNNKFSLTMTEEEPHSLWKWPAGRGKFTQMTWILTWPIHLVFLFTIPDCEKPRFKTWFPLTFIMCIIWIGSLSYLVAWMITIIGDTLRIPDSVMGITFLAAGTSVPEAVSSVIVSKQGHGSMGISNSIGSNTFDILLCLGLPWFIKATFIPTIADKHWRLGVKTHIKKMPNPPRISFNRYCLFSCTVNTAEKMRKRQSDHAVGINSAGIEYSAISLLSTLLLLYLTFFLNKFQLDKRVGRICLLMYAIFLILASLIELNVFFRVNLPTCGR